jgi:hypothetical protein
MFYVVNSKQILIKARVDVIGGSYNIMFFLDVIIFLLVLIRCYSLTRKSLFYPFEGVVLNKISLQ